MKPERVVSGIAIRLARSADASDIAAMSRDQIEHGLPWRWTPQRVARSIRAADTNVAVVESAGRVDAFGIMSYRADDAHLLLFAVRPTSQRTGVGTAVLQWLEDVARAAGAKRIRVEARWDNQPAREFYAQHGFHERVIARGMYSDRLDGVHLEKWLRVDET